jgi:hypothetical protein
MAQMVRVLAILGALSCAFGASAAEVVTAGRWEFHSSFWMSLHQKLIADAMRSTLEPSTGLSPEEQREWNDAVGVYRAAGGRGDMTFAKPMVIATDALTQVADDAVDLTIDGQLKEGLSRAAAVYRRHWWTADDQANRFLIAYAAAMLREVAEPLVRRHETVYRTAWPTRIRAYITPAAGPFGGYTMVGLSGGVITTMSCRDAGYQGLRAVEMLLHEGSHAIVGPNSDTTVGAAIATAAKAHGAALPRDLWHAIVFATSSELTRRVLAERGHTSFVPMSVDLFSRAWPKYREPVEKYWIAYLNGAGTLEEAIDKIVVAITR